MNSGQLKDILTKHRAWLNDENGGVRADLKHAVLRGADLRRADLSDANLSDADLKHAVLRGADLSCTDLSCADLRRADLSEADLSDADLRSAVLIDANLKKVSLNADSVGFFLACPEVGSFTAFKKASNYIVVLEIPADARRSSATTLKCRCDKAKVLRIENLDGSISDLKSVFSSYDNDFIYTVGETVCVDDFDTERWNECSRGIHFFLSRELAVQY